MEAAILRPARHDDSGAEANVETSAFRPMDVVVALRAGLPIHGRFSGREAGDTFRMGVFDASQVVVEHGR